MTHKRQQTVSFDLAPDELRLIRQLYPTALQNAQSSLTGGGNVGSRAEVNDMLAFQAFLQQGIAQGSITLQVKPTVIYWLHSVMNQFHQVGSTPIDITPFNEEDVRLLSLKLVEPFQGTNGSFYPDMNHK